MSKNGYFRLPDSPSKVRAVLFIAQIFSAYLDLKFFDENLVPEGSLSIDGDNVEYKNIQ